MAERTPDRRPSADRAPAPAPGGRTPLTDRWWWTGGALALVGVVVIAWQWPTISAGEAIVATWVVVALGLGAVGLGAIWVWRDRPGAASAPRATGPGAPAEEARPRPDDEG